MHLLCRRGLIDGKRTISSVDLIQILGSAAGGGLPQWNCACVNCVAARAKIIRRRNQASLSAPTRTNFSTFG